MDFYIKQNATLPILKVKVSKDGRSDFGNFQQSLSSSTIYFSMVDVDTNKPKILRGVANYIITPSSNGISEDEIYITYQFKNKDTKNTGKFSVEFELLSSQGVVSLPLSEKLYVNVIDSFIVNDLSYTDSYVISFSCC
jgi:hypothetical protein